MEFALRKFACLTVGDVLPITYNETQYELKVLELQPNDAVQIIECDMSVCLSDPFVFDIPNSPYFQVDFAPPVGYVENGHPMPSRLQSEVNLCSFSLVLFTYLFIYFVIFFFFALLLFPLL